ncbi:MAG: hypothetical protein ACOC1F_06870 [Myxococcota bacterium]
MPAPLPPNPIESLYTKPALELVLDSFDSVPVKGIDQVVAWINKAAEGVTDLREPTISVPLFETYVLSLLMLAKAVDDPAYYAPDFQANELDDIAALLLAAALVRRARAGSATAVAATEEGDGRWSRTPSPSSRSARRSSSSSGKRS